MCIIMHACICVYACVCVCVGGGGGGIRESVCVDRVRKEPCIMLCLVFQFKYILALFTHVASYHYPELWTDWISGCTAICFFQSTQQFVSFNLQSVRTTNLLWAWPMAFTFQYGCACNDKLWGHSTIFQSQWFQTRAVSFTGLWIVHGLYFSSQ